MKLLIALLVAVLCIYCTYAQTYTSDDVFVDNLKLYVEGKEFIIKGMAYSPAPVGILNMTAEGFMGGGYCSIRKTPFAEYKSACYGMDFIDGTKDTLRQPKGPSDAKGLLLPWWQRVWQRDLPKIKDLGANTIRIYNVNWITKHFLKMYPDAYPVKDTTVAAEHLPFLDYAHSLGFKVIMPIVQDVDLLTQTDSALLDKLITSAVTEIGNHPALLMWCLGNEIEVDKKPDLLAIINDKIDVIHQKMKSIHNRFVPVTHAVIDDPTTYEQLAADLKVDVFTTNAGYRDVVLAPLWDGETINGVTFEGWTKLSKKINKPIFLGEIGMHQENNQINKDRPDWFNQQWKAIVEHIDDGCIGATFFEYSDEPQKPNLQKTMGVVEFQATEVGTGTSKDANVWVPDTIVEKENIYAALKSGLDNSDFKKYNMNADMFTLLGRAQSTVAVKDPESSDPTTSTPAARSSVEGRPEDSNSGNGTFKITIYALIAVASIALLKYVF
jgi:hypothetical protein